MKVNIEYSPIHDRVNPREVGVLSRLIETRRALVVGRSYRIRNIGKTGEVQVVNMRLIKKYSKYARFRVTGLFGSYDTCFTYWSLLQELGAQLHIDSLDSLEEDVI